MRPTGGGRRGAGGARGWARRARGGGRWRGTPEVRELRRRRRRPARAERRIPRRRSPRATQLDRVPTRWRTIGGCAPRLGGRRGYRSWGCLRGLAAQRGGLPGFGDAAPRHCGDRRLTAVRLLAGDPALTPLPDGRAPDLHAALAAPAGTSWQPLAGGWQRGTPARPGREPGPGVEHKEPPRSPAAANPRRRPTRLRRRAATTGVAEHRAHRWGRGARSDTRHRPGGQTLLQLGAALGARPAHSRNRFSSRACAKNSSASSAIPTSAAKAAIAPTFVNELDSESASSNGRHELLGVYEGRRRTGVTGGPLIGLRRLDPRARDSLTAAPRAPHARPTARTPSPPGQPRRLPTPAGRSPRTSPRPSRPPAARARRAGSSRRSSAQSARSR